MAKFDSFRNRRTALLTTYKRDGTPVATPVTIAVYGDHAYVRTWDSAWKARRMRNNPAVSVAPATVRGCPTGEAVGRPRTVAGATDTAGLLSIRLAFQALSQVRT